MKNSKGELLQQPYLDLARMRREQQIDSEWVKTWAGDFYYTSSINYAFNWFATFDGVDFWFDVYYGHAPAIPASSLSELDEWRKEKLSQAASDAWIGKQPEPVEPEPADKWKAMYEEMKAERDYYRHEYELKSIELDDIDSKPTPNRNWIAEGRKRGHLPKNENE